MSRCFAAGCNKRIPSNRFGCRYHWFKLPREFRNEVWAAYRAKDRARTLELVKQAHVMSMEWDR